MIRRIEAQRVVLEPQVAAHAREMFALLQDPRIYEFENAPPPSEEWLCERYRRLESRRSADGTEWWLNWVVRLRTGEPAGYVQATIEADGRTLVAYEFASRWWGRGLAQESMRAMMEELRASHGARRFVAVFKRSNARSRALLERLGFAPAVMTDIEEDEDAMELVD